LRGRHPQCAGSSSVAQQFACRGAMACPAATAPLSRTSGGGSTTSRPHPGKRPGSSCTVNRPPSTAANGLPTALSSPSRNAAAALRAACPGSRAILTCRMGLTRDPCGRRRRRERIGNKLLLPRPLRGECRGEGPCRAPDVKYWALLYAKVAETPLTRRSSARRCLTCARFCCPFASCDGERLPRRTR